MNETVLYKICVDCDRRLDPCHEVCPFCGGTLVAITGEVRSRIPATLPNLDSWRPGGRS